MLCPQTMTAESPQVSLPGTMPKEELIASAGIPPRWKESWMKHIPFIGKIIIIGMNSSRYETTLEQNADLIAKDLSNANSEWKSQAVGVISSSK